MKWRAFGFSLPELMVALVISSVVLLGVSYTYSVTTGAVHATHNMQNAQEVLRYTSELFSRSLKQTEALPQIPDPHTLIIEQTQVGVMACNGSKPARTFRETYRLEGKDLVCQIDNGAKFTVLTGVESIQYRLVGYLVEVFVTPEHWMKESLPAGFRIDIALTSHIFGQMMGG